MGFNSGFKGLKRQGRQFSRLLAAEVCASAVVMLDTPCSVVVYHSLRQFPLHFPSRASPCAITFQLDSTMQAYVIGRVLVLFYTARVEMRVVPSAKTLLPWRIQIKKVDLLEYEHVLRAVKTFIPLHPNEIIDTTVTTAGLLGCSGQLKQSEGTCEQQRNLRRTESRWSPYCQPIYTATSTNKGQAWGVGNGFSSFYY